MTKISEIDRYAEALTNLGIAAEQATRYAEEFTALVLAEVVRIRNRRIRIINLIVTAAFLVLLLVMR